MVRLVMFVVWVSVGIFCSVLIYVVYGTFGDVCGLSFSWCLLFRFNICGIWYVWWCLWFEFQLVSFVPFWYMLGYVRFSIICQCLPIFVPHFVVSAWRLKCTKYMGPYSNVVPWRMHARTEDRWAKEIGWGHVSQAAVKIVMNPHVLWKTGNRMSSWATVGFFGKDFSVWHWLLFIVMVWQSLCWNCTKQVEYYQLWWKCIPFLVMTEVTLMLCWFYRAAQILCTFCPVHLVGHTQLHVISAM